MYPAGTPDLKYINYFLENTPSTSPYGIHFNDFIPKGSLQIEDVNGNPFFPGKGIKLTDLIVPAGYQSAIAEVDAVWTATEPTLAVNTDYSFIIYQYNTANNTWLGDSSPIRIFGDTQLVVTAGTVATQWAQQLNLYAANGVLQVTAVAVGAVCTITAKTGYPIMILKTPTNGVVLNESTAGVQSFGYPFDLAAKGYQLIGATQSYPFQATVVAPGGYLSSGVYDCVSFNFDVPLPGSFGGGSRKQRYKANLWIDQNGNNYAAWKTYFLSVTEGTISGYSPADTQLIS